MFAPKLYKIQIVSALKYHQHKQYAKTGIVSLGHLYAMNETQIGAQMERRIFKALMRRMRKVNNPNVDKILTE